MNDEVPVDLPGFRIKIHIGIGNALQKDTTEAQAAFLPSGNELEEIVVRIVFYKGIDPFQSKVTLQSTVDLSFHMQSAA